MDCLIPTARALDFSEQDVEFLLGGDAPLSE